MKMEAQKSFWEKYKYWIIISLVAIIIIGVTCFYLSIAAFFFTQNSRGELLKVLITIVGGFALFIGLMLNNDRIKTQTEQNTISATSNFDKRFGDAIGYLGSDNTTIVLGGIYALHQLANEDKRYLPIVAGLFTSFIKDKSKILYKKEEIKRIYTKENSRKIVPIEIATIIDLLFIQSKIYKAFRLNLSFSYLKNIELYEEINNCIFSNSTFINCKFNSNIFNSYFEGSEFDTCCIGRENKALKDCYFFNTRMTNTKILAGTIENCNFNLSKFSSVKFLKTKHIIECQLYAIDIIDSLQFFQVKLFKDIVFLEKNRTKIKFISCENQEGITYV